MSIVDEYLLKEIDEAKERIDESRLDTFVNAMCHNNIRQANLQAPIQDGDNASRRDEVIANFNRAWEYGVNNYNGFGLILLSEIVGKVEPALKSPMKDYAEFRQNKASLKGLDYLPPIDEQRIRAHLEKMLVALKTEDFHPVEEAVFLNFHLTRIQPFANGNKRTASIITNLTLNHNSFPVIYVRPEEKVIYTSLLDAATRSFGEQQNDAYLNPNYQQRGFLEFMGNKVLRQLQCAEDELAQLCRYHIDMDIKSPGVAYAVKQRVDSWFRRRDKPYQLTLSPKAGTLDVVGAIPYEVLDEIVGRSNDNGKKKIKKYRIITLSGN